MSDSLNKSHSVEQNSDKNDKNKNSLNSTPSSSSSSSKVFGYFEGEDWFVGNDMSGIQTKYDLLVKNRLNQQRIRNLSPRVVREQEDHDESEKLRRSH